MYDGKAFCAVCVAALMMSACGSTDQGSTPRPALAPGVAPTDVAPTPPPTSPPITTPPPVAGPATPVDTGLPMAGAAAMPPMQPEVTPTEPAQPAVIPTGITGQPIDYADPNMTCYEFRAHEGTDLAQPLTVGIANDAYREVDFQAPWTGTVYARSFKALIDNAEVIHHWLFYMGGSGGQRSLQAGWAPGGTDTYMSPDLGVELPQGAYSLQFHYNSGDAAAVDASGVEVCVTTQKPENVATVSWLGTDAISGTEATSVCDPVTNERIHIVAATPHMHKKGIHFKAVINRAAGGTEVAHDADFDFAFQQQYPEDLWIEPGDTITSTCTYNAPASFGPGTDAEMCYWFAVHYPANALVDDGFIGKAIHGPNSCLGM